MSSLSPAVDAAADTAGAPAPSQPVALAALVAGALAIAFAPILVRLSEVGPVSTGFWRVALAVPVLWAWRLAERRAELRKAADRPRPTLRGYAGLAACGVFFAADLAIWHFSIRLTTVANATLLGNFAPVFVTLGAWLLFGERCTRMFLAGLALALGGAAVLMGAGLSLGHGPGDALGLITAMFYGAYILTVGRMRANHSTAAIMAWGSTIAALALLPVVPLFHEPLLPHDLAGWAVLLGLGLVVQCGGQSLIAFALAHLPASFSSVTLLLQPVTAAILAWTLLGESAGAIQVAGGVLVLAGILIARRASR